MGASSGQNAYGPFSVPLGLQGSVIGGNPFAVQAQQPFLQSRLANTQGTGFQQTGGIIPSLGAGGSVLSGVGSSIGGVAALAKLCWIAQTLYGDEAWQVPVLRDYITGPLSETKVGRTFANWYRANGQAVATRLRQHPENQAPFRVLFDGLLRDAMGAA